MDKAQARAYIDGLRYIPARDQWPNRGNDTRWVVLHTIEGPEAPTSAEGCANYFANPGNRTASTQFCVDTDSTVRCAELDKVVAGAVGANHKGIHIEQAGVAAQSPAEWRDTYSMRMVLGQTAPLVAALCVLFDIPVQFVKADGLRAGVRGVTTHAECWKAFGGDYRSDPGEHYPVAEVLDEARRLIDGTPEEDDMPKYRDWERADQDALAADVARKVGELLSGRAKAQGQAWAFADDAKQIAYPTIPEAVTVTNLGSAAVGAKVIESLKAGGTVAEPADVEAVARATADELAERLKD